MIAAIGAYRDVHLLLLHPSRDLWGRVAAAVAVGLPDHPATSALPLRDDDPTAALPRNPLLRSWGRDIRELQLTAPLAAATLAHHDVDHATEDDRTLLQRLQDDVRAEHRADADAGAPDAPPALRVRLADRALRRTNPVLEVVSRVLELVDARITVSDVLDLVARPPVRRRFRFTDDDLDALETWIGDLQIRWGFDADHRRLSLPTDEHNSLGTA